MLKKNDYKESSFTEFELLNHFIKNSHLKKNYNIIVPSGDDAFVGKIENTLVVITTDTLTQNSDFKLNWYTNPYYLKNFGLNFRQLGIKLARINLSDIFSMGNVKPLWAVGNFLLNNNITKKDVFEIFYGARNELKKFNCEIVGGDISKSKELSFSLTIVGLLQDKKPILRTGFNFEDYLCVTGTLGDSAAGLKILQNPNKYFNTKIVKYLIILVIILVLILPSTFIFLFIKNKHLTRCHPR
jgi:thiamine-monophosphate kinase